ncbi:hypothetical protein CDD83_5576 [Cordyceps sp. RAO-2017]|nr:hypothetical protein CDD83_5576 [Cordyceps sp. RAO-2017]
MVSILSLVLGLACLCHVSLALSGEQVVQDLQRRLSPGSKVVLASDAAFAKDFTPRFSITTPPVFVVAAKPRLVTDVQQIVRYASRNHVPFLATGGGHGYSSTLGRLRHGILLDLGHFDAVEVDAAANTMTVGGAARSVNVSSAVQAAGKEIPVGQCICIGYAGATMGGGIGPYSGLYGTQSDSLLSAEMVTGTGDIVTVSEAEHPDLFYAVKGAGFNYGIATSLTYAVYPATNGGRAVNADMIFPGHLNGSVWRLAASFVGRQPKELSITLAVGYDPKLGGLFLIGNFIYAGPRAQGLDLIQPFLDLKPLNVSISTVEWKDVPAKAVYGHTLAGCTPGAHYVPFAANLYRVDVPSLVSLANYMDEAMSADPALRSTIIAWAQYAPHGFQRHADASSAFPHRDAVVFAQIDGFAEQAAQVPALARFGRDLRRRLQRASGRDALAVYAHFAHGDEAPEAWYSASRLARLRALKAVYDPENLFSYYNPVLGRSGCRAGA